MRSLILSQWRDLRIGVTREDLGALTTVRARQFLRQKMGKLVYSTILKRLFYFFSKYLIFIAIS